MAGLGDDAAEGVSAQGGQPTALCSVIVRRAASAASLPVPRVAASPWTKSPA
ncbi:hypothetical protein [Streptomyces sp. A1547]|uniref:Uncharacterized protein n=1 Tax=Streptomyces sp. R33 TaxID=3238629 RepID=A0AB39YH06_9ACTN|nr:hypothetical protein [Streptomyces sp. A1547]